MLRTTSRHGGRAAAAAAILAGVGMLAAGCASTAGNSASSSDPASGSARQYAGQTIVIDYFSAPPGAKFLSDFTKETGIKVQWNQFSFDNLQTKIQTAMSAHVYFADVTDLGLLRMGTFTKENWYTPLQKYIPPETLEQQVPLAKGWVVDGNLVGVPVDGQIGATTLNMAMFKKAGIDSAPTTFAEFEKDLKQLQSSGVSAHPLDIPFAPAEGLSTQWYQYTMAFGGSVLTKNDAPAFTSPTSAGYKAFDWMVDAFKSGLVPPQNINYTDVQSQQSEMARGVTAANFSDYTDDVGSIYDNPKLSSVVGQVQYAATPGVDGPAGNQQFPDGMVVPSTAKHAGAAAAFIKYFVSARPNAQINGLSGTDYSIPEWSGPAANNQSLKLLETAGKLTHGKAIAGLLSSSKPDFPQGSPVWYPQFAQAAYQQLRAAAQGQETVPAAIASLAQTVNTLRNS